MTYFNEIDKFAAAWLRELMKAGVITEGVVDERSVEDVAPNDLAGHGRVHLFAGIGTWDYALTLAGWPADRECWTCSCPCQPFSQAGKGGGFGDERHLWPAAFHLIRERRPGVCFGEQVASDDGLTWLDLVLADLEGVGYTVGATVTPAAGYGAPHGRHRIYWVAKKADTACRGEVPAQQRRSGRCVEQGGSTCELADTSTVRREWRGPSQASGRHASEPQRLLDAGELGDTIGSGVRGGGSGETGIPASGLRGEAREQRIRADLGPDGRSSGTLADADGGQSGITGLQPCREHGQQPQDGVAGARAVGVTLGDADSAGRERQQTPEPETRRATGRAGPVNGFWGNAVWLPCLDGKQRPVEPCAEPLVDGFAGDLGLVRLASYPDHPHEERIIYAPLIQKGKARAHRLRGYGNAVVLPQAVEFIRVAMQCLGIKGTNG